MFFWTWFGMVGVGVWQVRQSKPWKLSEVPWQELQSMAPATWTAGAPIAWILPVEMGKKEEVC